MVCSQCGAKVTKGMESCKECGAPLGAKIRRRPMKRRKRKQAGAKAAV